MTRSAIVVFIRITAVVLMTMVSVWFVATAPVREVGYAAFFAALVAVAELLRIDTSDRGTGFEVPVVLGVIILFHDPALAAFTALLGITTAEAVRAMAQRRAEFRLFAWGAELAAAYGAIALLYTSAVVKDAPTLAKFSGYCLLLAGYCFADLLIFTVRRTMAADTTPVDIRGVLGAQVRLLLYLSPVAGIEVMLHRSYGIAGAAAAFLPVVVLAYAMRSASEATRRNEELARRNRELSILTESSTHVLAADDEHERLRRLTELLSQLARMKAAAVVTWDLGAEVPATVHRFADCERIDEEIVQWVESAGFAQSAPSRAFVFQNELRRFPLSSGRAIQVLIGIQTTEIIYGLMIYETEDLSILKSGSLNLLTLLVSQTALAMQDQLLRREADKKTRLLEHQAATSATILEVANGLIGYYDVEGALTRIAHAVRKTLGFEVVVFGLYDAENRVYVRRAHAGLDDVWEDVRKKHVAANEIDELFIPEFRIGNTYFVSAAALRRSETDLFVVAEERKRQADVWNENDMLIVPLLHGGQKLGYLSLRQPYERNMLTPEQFQTLEIFTAQAVTALQSARQYEEIRRLTFIDSLTSAYNHRYFQDALAREIHRHSRTGHEFAVAMLDIDNFKRVNDSFGHPVGDRILKGLVEELLRNARDSDVVARYGGEEFAIVLPDTPAQSAREAANRFRELIERRTFHVPQVGRELHVTVSIGLSVYPRDGVSGADLISRADEALYYCKKNGKNQVALASDVLGPAQISLAPVLVMPVRSTWAG